MSRRLILDTKGGLCNRILALASAWRLAEHHNRELLLGNWQRTQVYSRKLPLSYGGVFDLPFRFATKHERTGKSRCSPDQKWPARFGVPASGDHPCLWVLGYTAFYDSSEPTAQTPVVGWDPGFHTERLRSWAQRIQPAQAVLDRLAVQGIGQGSYVGVHVRRGDHKIARKYSPTHKFVKAMRQYREQNPLVGFLLCTDDPQVEELMHKEFGGIIRTLPKRTLDRGRLEGHIDAFVDLLALSRSSLIIGSAGSSFSMTAALLGNIPLVVE